MMRALLGTKHKAAMDLRANLKQVKQAKKDETDKVSVVLLYGCVFAELNFP